ncbi:hypothetical protein GGR51DRAFT_305695 [Nemania sp. FL0031]|nr:hypothetical protein GGR51DRAFT_305695 [Nemania sp. FL0031]
MQQSWLLRFSFLIVATTRGTLGHSHESESSIEMSYSVLRQSSPIQEVIIHRVVIPEAIGNRGRADGPLDEVTDPTSIPMEREAPVLRMPRPTAAPSLRKRQDDGQIQALSAQLQSATEAISSVSLSASLALSQMSQSAQSVRQSADQASQSFRQSADQAVQSANQAADQANRQLSQTQSSASSAVSAANSRASDQLSQSLASMSSRIASAQSSANDAISSARAAASQFAASQIQAFQADASGAGGITSPPISGQQAQSNSISTTTFAIIIVVSIIGTAILTVISSCLFLRYRRKKRSSRRGVFESNEKSFDKPIAVRGSLSPPSPRFGGSSRSRMDNFKLPTLSPLLQSKKAQREARKNIGFASSEYSGGEEEAGMAKQFTNDADSKLDDADSTQPSKFRLQKNNGVSSATTVRLIRVGSDNRKSSASMNPPKNVTEPMPPPPVVTAPDPTPKTAPISTPNQPSTSAQSSLQPSTIITQPPKAKEPPPPEDRRVSSRSIRSNDTETPGWRPPMRLTAASANRFTFRDSSDMESNAPTPTNPSTMPPPPNTNRPSFPLSRQSNMLPGRASGSGTAYLNRAASTTGRPKNGAGTFATFPRTRAEPPRQSMPAPRESAPRENGSRENAMRESVMNRGRPNRNYSGALGATLRREEERRRRELAELTVGRSNTMSTRYSRDIFDR